GGGDVGDFRARGPHVRHHRLEHLRGDDDRHLGRVRLPDDLLLDVRHVLERDVDAQVAAGDHHRVDGAEDGRKVVEHLVAFELGDEGNVGALRVEEAAHFADVGGGAHERHGDEVHALLDPEPEVLDVLVGQAGRGQIDVRQ